MTHDLRADLLADLTTPPDRPELVGPSAPVPPDPVAATPVLTATLTPLHWSRPRLVRAERGAGQAVEVGPLRLEVSVRALGCRCGGILRQEA